MNNNEINNNQEIGYATEHDWDPNYYIERYENIRCEGIGMPLVPLNKIWQVFNGKGMDEEMINITPQLQLLNTNYDNDYVKGILNNIISEVTATSDFIIKVCKDEMVIKYYKNMLDLDPIYVIPLKLRGTLETDLIHEFTYLPKAAITHKTYYSKEWFDLYERVMNIVVDYDVSTIPMIVGYEEICKELQLIESCLHLNLMCVCDYHVNSEFGKMWIHDTVILKQKWEYITYIVSEKLNFNQLRTIAYDYEHKLDHVKADFVDDQVVRLLGNPIEGVTYSGGFGLLIINDGWEVEKRKLSDNQWHSLVKYDQKLIKERKEKK